MSEFVFVPASALERGEVAAYLVALAEEKGISAREIRSVIGGYQAPAALVGDPEAYAPVPDDKLVTKWGEKTPPPGWDDPAPKVDIEVSAEGEVTVKDDSLPRIEAELAEEAAPKRRGRPRKTDAQPAESKE